MDAAEYKHVVLGLIFLKYISDAFEAKHAELDAQRAEGNDPEDPDEFRAVNIFWVPAEARWSHLKANAPQPTIGTLVDRTHRELTDADIAQVAGAYHAWRGDAPGTPSPSSAREHADGVAGGPRVYADVPGFCKAATLDDIRKHGHVLTPGRYVGAAAVEDDGEPFAEKMERLTAELAAHFADAARLDAEIRTNLARFGYVRWSPGRRSSPCVTSLYTIILASICWRYGMSLRANCQL